MRKILYKTFCLLIVLGFVCTLSGCGVFDLLRYVLSLPLTILDTVTP